MKKINPNNEINTKILQILDESESAITITNKSLETFDIIWEEENWNVENNNPYKD